MQIFDNISPVPSHHFQIHVRLFSLSRFPLFARPVHFHWSWKEVWDSQTKSTQWCSAYDQNACSPLCVQELFLSSVYNFQYLTTNFASQSAVGPHVFPLADINVFLAIYFDKVLASFCFHAVLTFCERNKSLVINTIEYLALEPIRVDTDSSWKHDCNKYDNDWKADISIRPRTN